jgi:hypothetical protein
MRKKISLKPKDEISVQYMGTPDLNKILTKNKKFILDEAKIRDLTLGKEQKHIFDVEKELKVDQKKLWLGIKKI